MARLCSICHHPERAAIEAALEEGVSFDEAARRFDVTKSALSRHRANHQGREIRVHFPARSPVPARTNAVPDTAPTVTTQAPNAEATLAALFERAKVQTEQRSLRDYTRLALDGAAHLYAQGIATGDSRLAGAALRELRHLLALPQVQALLEALHPGGQAETQPRNDLWDAVQFVIARATGNKEQELKAIERLGWDEQPLEDELEPVV